ncbi:hypothetical protein GCM10009804_58910 [Kribbella hippodromi]|uniref:SDR family oxidoreductase n=1 Tax=Kribbella hippodromi TaxID=434347 RepID=A0ABN2E5X0_9ACTN
MSGPARAVRASYSGTGPGEKLAAAAGSLGGAASWRVVDSADKASLAAFVEPLGRIDHLFTPAAPAYVACNAAVEGLGRGLAFELAPVRVNVVSPGTIDGNLWAQRSDDVREAGLARYRRDSLLGRVGSESEVAETVVFLFTNGFLTGATKYPDGGYCLR